MIVPVKPALYAGRAGWQNHAAYCSPPGLYHTAIDELQRQRGEESPKEARWALANALTVVAEANMVDEIESLIHDHRYAEEQKVLKLAQKKLATKRPKPNRPTDRDVS